MDTWQPIRLPVLFKAEGPLTAAASLRGRIPKNIADELHRRRHPVRSVEDYTDTMGHAGAIFVDQASGVLQGNRSPGNELAAAY